MSNRDLAVGWCTRHQKLSYKNRKDAKQIAKRHHPVKSAFLCDPDMLFPVWHIGTLPVMVKKGIITRDHIFQKAA